MSYARHVLTHLRKDLRLEWRTERLDQRHALLRAAGGRGAGMAFDPASYPTMTRQISGGLLWVALLFASMTALNQSWARETSNHVLDAHRLSPAPASALFRRQGAGELPLCHGD